MWHSTFVHFLCNFTWNSKTSRISAQIKMKIKLFSRLSYLLYWIIEFSTISLLNYWMQHYFIIELLNSALFHYWIIEFSTISLLNYWIQHYFIIELLNAAMIFYSFGRCLLLWHSHLRLKPCSSLSKLPTFLSVMSVATLWPSIPSPRSAVPPDDKPYTETEQSELPFYFSLRYVWGSVRVCSLIIAIREVFVKHCVKQLQLCLFRREMT
jgi:hypothetical protein